MAKLKELETYLDYEFSSGYYTGQDYKTFERKYINYLKIICKENGWELARVNKNHYEFSAFFKYENKYIYMSISDVRYWKNEWYNRILIRKTVSVDDYHGDYNRHTNLQNLPNDITELFSKELW